MSEEKVLTARLYDIQGFSVQDGPGIRTTAFLKGCPLHCPWCHSPESQAYFPQLSYIDMRCLGVEACDSRCIKACPHNAIELGGERLDTKTNEMLQTVHVKRDLCDNCFKCAEVCYPDALYRCGDDYTVDQLVARLLQDRRFFKRGGGVTISGGECLTQPAFVLEVLKRLKDEGINTAVDTTGFCKWEIIESIMPYTDLFLYDLKHMDSEKHKAVTGVPNEIILDNCRKIAEFCVPLGDAVTVIQLLPYHNLGVTKYLRISDKPVMEATPPTDEFMEKLKAIMEEYGLPVTIH